MKKTLKTVLPSLIMLFLVYLMRDGKDILDGIYIIFPVLYIAIGVISCRFIKEFLVSAVLTSVAFLIPVNLCFNMGTCIDLALIYFALGAVSYFVKRKIKSKNFYRKKTKNL